MTTLLLMIRRREENIRIGYGIKGTILEDVNCELGPLELA